MALWGWYALAIGAALGPLLMFLVFALWEVETSLSPYLRPLAYGIGLLPLLGGFTLWALLTDSGPAAGALWLICTVAGACDAAAYLLKWAMDQRTTQRVGTRQATLQADIQQAIDATLGDATDD